MNVKRTADWGPVHVAMACAALALLAFAALARLAPEVRRGELLPFFESYEVAEVRLFGMRVYADTSAGLADLLTVSALAGTSVALGLSALLMYRRGATSARAFGVAALGAAFLAADDILAAHETVGHNLGFLASLPVIDHPDDVIVALYGLVIAAFAWRNRALAAHTPRWPWIACAVTGALAVGHDFLPLHLGLAEEGSEVLAGLALLTGVCMVAAGHLRGNDAITARRPQGPAA